MQLAFAAHLPFRRTRSAGDAHAGHRRRQPAMPATTTQLARRGAGDEDRAFYACACGYAFTAAVSTTVGCPHCGTAQAW